MSNGLQAAAEVRYNSNDLLVHINHQSFTSQSACMFCFNATRLSVEYRAVGSGKARRAAAA